MSRIAGLYFLEKPERTESFPSPMLDALKGGAGWRSAIESEATCAFAWCGWTGPNLARADQVCAVVDGHFYNTGELPPGGNEAEILITSYREIGFEKTLHTINGDFAAALFDAAKNTLYLARDRFGIKPLYYVPGSDRFAFASRPRALLALPGVEARPNRAFAARFAGLHYRTFDNAPDESPYEDIAQLPAAHFLQVSAGGTRKHRYWALEEQPDFTENEKELAEQYRELLLDAVSLRLRTAQKPVFTLSGGMDSSSVLASAVNASGRKLPAVSTVYEDPTYDESTEIQSMLETHVEKWHSVKLDVPDVFALVEKMVAAHDEPVATATWLSHYLLCEKMAEEGFGSLFGGLGGDELNAGEYEYFFYHFADLRAAGREQQLKREIADWIRYHDHPVFKKTPEVAEQGLKKLVDPRRPGRCLPDPQRLRRYIHTVNAEFYDLASFEPVMNHPFTSYLKNRTFQDIFRETAPCCLRAEDRQATAFGLENFLPFFDYRLVEFMFRVPGPMKIRDGITKRLLREAMRGLLPEDTRTRVKKTGWNAPAHVWFSGKRLEPLRDLVRSKSFQDRGIYNVPAVESIIDEHEETVSSGAARENHMMFLWQLINLELWLASLDD